MPQEPRALEKVSQAAPERCGKNWGSSPRFRESFLTRHPLPSPALRHVPVGPQERSAETWLFLILKVCGDFLKFIDFEQGVILYLP